MAMDQEDCRSTQLIYGNGEFNAEGLSRFIESVKLSKCGVSYAVVAIMGPQSSGKSVLLNNLFRTNFVVMDARQGRSQTTKGIWIAKADDVEPLTIVMDVEGNDGQERGEDQTFERQSAMFALAVADVVLMNIWCTDVGREAGAGKPILRTVFQVMAKLSISAPPRKTTLLFVLRDKTETPLHILEKQLIESTENIWMEVRKPKARKNSALSDFFTVKVTTLPHFVLQKEKFKEEVAQLKKKFHNSIAPGGLACDRQGVVEASGFAFSAKEMWKSIRNNKDLDLPTHKMAVASFRCDEVITEIYRRFREDERWLKIETSAKSSPIPDFGKQLSSILETFLSMYDKETEYFEEGVRDAKRKTLEFNLLQVARPTYETLLKHLLSHATESFKTQLKEELSRRGNKGFEACVLECTTSCMADFDKRCACADAKIQQPDWNKFSSIVRDKLEYKINRHSSDVREKKLSEIVTRLEKKLSEGGLEDSTVSLLKQGNKDSWPSIRNLLWKQIESVSSDFNGSISDGFELEKSKHKELLQGLKNYATRIVEKAARDTAKTNRVLSYMKDRFSSLLHYGQDSNSRPRVLASKWFKSLVRLGGRDSRRWNGDEDIDEIVSYATRECVGLLSVMAAIRLDEQLDDNIESSLMSSFLPNNKHRRFAFWNSNKNDGDKNDNRSWDKVSPDYILITPSNCAKIRDQFSSDIPEIVNKFRETLVDTANSSCEEIAGEILDRFRADQRWLELLMGTAAAKSPPSLGFGKQLSSLLDTFLSMYDKETELEVFNHQGVRDAKRKKLAFDLLHLVRPAYETQLKHLTITATKMFETQLEETLREKKLGLADSVDECRKSCFHQFDEWCADAAIQQADWSNASKMAKATLSHKISEHSRSVLDNKLSEIVARLEKKLSDGPLAECTGSFLEEGNKSSWPLIRNLLRSTIESVSSEFKDSISELEVKESRREDILEGLKNYATRIVENAARETAKRVPGYITLRFLYLFNLDKDSKPRIWKGDENIEEIVKDATRQCAELLSVMAAIRLDDQPDDNENLIIACLSTPEFDGNAEEGSPITNYVDCWNKVSPHYTILKPTECVKIWKQFIKDIQPTIDRAVASLEACNKKAAKKFRRILGGVLKAIAPLATVLASIVGVRSGLMDIREKDDFSISGPHHLTLVDWTSKDHCRSIAASLVNGVYLLENARQKKREGQETLVSKWWEHFQFKLIETHKDVRDKSIFAATFEYIGDDSTPNHPRYVLAFRGTLTKLKNLIRDFELDARVVTHKTLAIDQRYQTALNVLEKPPLRDVNRRQIWMVGHSLGAILALRVGKTMAKQGCYIESYLFNPPFPGPVELIKKWKLKMPIHVLYKFFKALLIVFVKDSSSVQEHISTFLAFNEWTPHLFVHPRDPISSGYIEYFESRQLMQLIGLGCLNSFSDSSSFINLIAEAIGRGGEPTHLIPSAYVIKNVGSNAILFKAHSIKQWWQQKLHCESKRHHLDSERSHHETQALEFEDDK